MGDYRLCHAAQDESLNPGASVGAYDYQIRLPLVCGIDNRCSRITLANGRLDGQAGAGDSFAGLSCDPLRVGGLALTNFVERR
jgi:hypothetical protein